MSAPLLDSSPSVSLLSDSSSPGRIAGSRRRSRLAVGALAVVVALGAAACGDDGGSGGGDASADLPAVADSEYTDKTGEDAVTVQARDNSFVAQYITVTAGTEVTFDNRGRNPHNVISVESGAFADIPTEDLQPKDTASITFDEVGEFPYYCSLHATTSKGMTGRIRVVAAD